MKLKPTAEKEEGKSKSRRMSIKGSFIREVDTRIIPHGLQDAHSVAVDSFRTTLTNMQPLLQSKHSLSLRECEESGEENINEDQGGIFKSLMMDLKVERDRFQSDYDREAFDSMWG